MCSRFEQNIYASELAGRFDLGDIPALLNAVDVRPTDQAMVITTKGNARFAGWGFAVPWTSQPMINARSETLRQKPTFQNRLENRCIIPANCYFEWRKEGSVKLKNRISVEGTSCFSMAGLLVDNCFTIITCAATPSISAIHSRMPVILSPKEEAAWINPNLDFSDVSHLLRPNEKLALVATEEILPEPAQRDLFV